MHTVTIFLAAATLFSMAIVLTYILGWANKAFHVEVDERIERIMDEIPGANCGGCGYAGCGEYANAVVNEGAAVDLCAPGGNSCASAIAEIMGVKVGDKLPFYPIVHCGATYNERLGRSQYMGEVKCITANLVADFQGCVYGCLGFGDCASVCDYDAIHVVNGLATVDYEKCIGCGACSRVCPRNIITITPFKSKRMLAILCCNKDSGKEVSKVCSIGCLGCKACTRISPLFTVSNNLSTINYEEDLEDKMEELMAASKKCPRKRITFVGSPLEKDEEGTLPDEGEEPPEVIEADFKTTVDDTKWRG